jgi:hypothetical protein
MEVNRNIHDLTLQYTPKSVADVEEYSTQIAMYGPGHCTNCNNQNYTGLYTYIISN